MTTTNEAPAAAIDLDLQRTLLDVLAAGDDDRLFQVVGRQPDDGAAYQFLCEEVPRLTLRARGKLAFSELLFIPVIERSHGATIANQRVWEDAERCLADALDEWLPRGVRKTVFRGIRPYEWVAAWAPSVLRKHLLAAIPGGVVGRCSFTAEAISLPSDAPRLGFFLVAVTSGAGWPQRSVADPLRDVRFRTVVAQALDGVSAPSPPSVLAPHQMRFAISEGLCLWLSELHQLALLEGWSLLPVRGDSDLCQLSIHLRSEERRSVQLGLRRYQVGPNGINRLASNLGTRAREMRPALMQ